MNRIKKALAFLAAVTMAFGMISCGDSEDSTPSAITTAETDSSSVSTTAATTTASGDTTAVTAATTTTTAVNVSAVISKVHKEIVNVPYQMKATFNLPRFEGMQLQGPETVSQTHDTSAKYIYTGTDGKTQLYSVNLRFYPLGGSSYESMKQKAQTGDGYAKYENGNLETYRKTNQSSGKNRTEELNIIGGRYYDGVSRLQVEVSALKGRNDTVVDEIIRSITAGASIQADESGIRTSDGFSFGQKGIGIANQVRIAGNTVSITPYVQDLSITSRANFDADGVTYEVSTGSFLAKSAYDAKTDGMTECTLAGKPAKAAIKSNPNGSISLDGMILLDDQTALQVFLVTESAANQTALKDAASLVAKTKDMMSSQKKAATTKALIGYLTEYCSALRFDDPALPAVTTVTGSDGTTKLTVPTTITTTSLTTITTTVLTTRAPRTEKPVETEAPVTTKTVSVPSEPDGLLDLSKPFRSKKEIAISGTGYAYAKSGLRMREAPSTSAEQLNTLPFGTTVEILALAVNGDSYASNSTRWYRVKADGQVGYVSASYLAATFTQKPDALSDEQLAAMVNFLYCQHSSLFISFALDGGLNGETDANDTLNSGEYERVRPSELTIDQINEEFYRYFARSYHYNELTQGGFYISASDKLYVRCPNVSGPSISRQIAEKVTDISDSEITAFVRHYYTKDRSSDTEYYTEYEFSLCYEDGCWKVGKSDSIYSDFTRQSN
ncbi:MAG: SH3 domain-containing protein [Oscillospiraceae bacterium]|nr:SH3 domain-containing protein [Oscillospiraceae bacterium]